MLNKKIIIVTGGSGLIGKAIMKKISNEGGIPVNADISVTTDLEKGTIQCDITNDVSITETIEKVVKHFGKIDGLVNNAYPRTKDWGAKFENITSDSLRKNIDMQMNSYILCCQKAIKVMKKQGEGAIVNIASIYGIVAPDFTVYEETDMTSPAAYNAIKGGIINFSRYLASYVGKDNIRVNCVSPGGIFASQPASFVRNYSKKVPLKRMGRPEDIVSSICFLLSDEAAYITGHNLVVDGGWTCI